jgi:tetratricopeptide (TPR) repeat protein
MGLDLFCGNAFVGMKTKTRRPRQRARAHLMQRLDTALAALMHAELVKPSVESPSAYLFKHALVQETAESTLLRGEHKRLHLLVARALETVNAENLDAYAAELAQHYAFAQDDAKTLVYALRAGELAARLLAHKEALAQYALADEIVRRGGANNAQIIQLYQQRGRVLEVMGKYHDAIANYEQLQELASTRHDPALELAAIVALATLYATPTAFADAHAGESLCRQALALARALGDRATEAKILWVLMLVTFFSKRLREALTYGEQSLALARALNLREQMAFTLNDLSRPYLAVGPMERALAALAEAGALWQEVHNLPMYADNLNSTAEANYLKGDFETARAHLQAALPLSQKIDNPWNQGFSWMIELLLRADLGEADQALYAYEQGMRLGRQIVFGGGLLFARLGLARLCGTLGAARRGIELLQQPDASLERYAFAVAPIHAALALLLVQVGEPNEAETHLQQARRSVTAGDFASWGPVLVAHTEAELALVRGKPLRAEEEMRALIDDLIRVGMRVFLPEAYWLQSRALRALGRPDDAYAALHRARVEAERIGMRRVLWQIYAALSEMENARGNFAPAHAYRTRAREEIEFMLLHAPAEFRASFLNVPNVRAMMDART